MGRNCFASGGGGGFLSFYTTNFTDLQPSANYFTALKVLYTVVYSKSLFESDLLENVQVVATKAGHYFIRVDSCQVTKLEVKRSIVCSLGHLGLARSLRFEKKTSMMLSVRFVEMIIYLLL